MSRSTPERTSYSVDEGAYGSFGKKYFSTMTRVEKRSAEVAQGAFRRTADDTIPQVSSLVYARTVRYRHRKTPTRATPEDVVRGIIATVHTIKAQRYPDERKSNIVAAVSSLWANQIDEGLQAANVGVRLESVKRGVNHAAAYNQGIEALDRTEGLAWLTEAGARLAANQAFQIGALTMADGDVVATQGMRFSAKEPAGRVEAAFYSAASWHPNFWGHRDRIAKPDMGLVAADRTLVHLPTMLENPYDDKRYPNGGFDGAWGQDMRLMRGEHAVKLDFALSTLFSEGLPPLDTARMVLQDWPERGQPGAPYLDPGF